MALNNYESENYVPQHSTSEEEWHEQLTTVGKFRKDIQRKYEAVGSARLMPADLSKEFRDELNESIAKIEALEGPLYTKEGKKAQIQEEIDKLAKKHEESFAERVKEANETVRWMNEQVEAELAKQEQLGTSDVQRIQLRYNELQAEIQSKLAVTADSFKVQMYFNDLVRKAEHDKDLARFLSKHYYLFVQRVREVEQNTAANVAPIVAAAQKVQNMSYSKKQLALHAMQKKLKGMMYSGSGRLLQHTVKNLKNKYR